MWERLINLTKEELQGSLKLDITTSLLSSIPIINKSPRSKQSSSSILTLESLTELEECLLHESPSHDNSKWKSLNDRKYKSYLYLNDLLRLNKHSFREKKAKALTVKVRQTNLYEFHEVIPKGNVVKRNSQIFEIGNSFITLRPCNEGGFDFKINLYKCDKF
jgi:hypothetical protein